MPCVVTGIVHYSLLRIIVLLCNTYHSILTSVTFNTHYMNSTRINSLKKKNPNFYIIFITLLFNFIFILNLNFYLNFSLQLTASQIYPDMLRSSIYPDVSASIDRLVSLGLLKALARVLSRQYALSAFSSIAMCGLQIVHDVVCCRSSVSHHMTIARGKGVKEGMSECVCVCVCVCVCEVGR